jgi:hypothetical protein
VPLADRPLDLRVRRQEGACLPKDKQTDSRKDLIISNKVSDLRSLRSIHRFLEILWWYYRGHLITAPLVPLVHHDTVLVQ